MDLYRWMENVFKFVIFIEYKYLIFLPLVFLDLSFIYCVHLNMSFNVNEIYLLFIWWEIQIKSWDDVKNVYGFCVRRFHLWFCVEWIGLCVYAIELNKKLFEIDEFLLLTKSVVDMLFENWLVWLYLARWSVWIQIILYDEIENGTSILNGEIFPDSTIH